MVQEPPTTQQRTAQPTVGIVTALPKESLPVQAMLQSPAEMFIPEGDRSYRYLVGTVPAAQGGSHTVVTSLLTDMGNNSAASRATLLIAHFPSVRWLLMVGIAGGVPNPDKASEHVRLGDIVVSDRNGVVQYDFIKEAIGEKIERHPPRPPGPELLDAVHHLEMRAHAGSYPWVPFIQVAAEAFGQPVTRPPDSADVLFSSDQPQEVVPHPNDPDRSQGYPRVFAGPIASANTLLKDPKRRDQLRDRFGVKAVEMEGSGIAEAAWDATRSFLVVRGICDYCDSHKNDEWQKYAAVVAAAYMRALLESLPAAKPPRPPTTSDGTVNDTTQRPWARGGMADAVPHQPPMSALHQLPADIGDFTGRRDEVRELASSLKKTSKRGRTAPVVRVIHGPPGAGKSTLALHVAHKVGSHFPDGQLYADLRGASDQPLEWEHVLGRFLLGLGVAASAIPESPTARLDLYRSRLSGRRVLVVLDNVSGAAQVRMLIPAEAQCGVLITSAQPLTGLTGAATTALGVLPENDALKLLKHVAGAGRIESEEQCARHLVRNLCGGFPIAIRICGSQLRIQGVPVAELARRLADQRQRLQSLQTMELDVRASFAFAYDALPPPEQRLFRHLGLFASPLVQVPVAAAFLEVDPDTAFASLNRLLEAGLLIRTPNSGLYAMHDLLHLYAKELMLDESEESRRAAWVRAAPTYALAVVEMGLLLHRQGPAPGLIDSFLPGGLSRPSNRDLTPLDALTWFEMEFGNVVMAIEACYDAEQWYYVAVPCISFASFLKLRSNTASVRRAYSYALRASKMLGDRISECYSHLGLAGCDRREMQCSRALDHCARSLSIAREYQLRPQEASSLLEQGAAYRQMGFVDQAIEAYEQGLHIARELGELHGEAAILTNLAIAYRHKERLPEAVSCLEHCIHIYEELGDVHGEAIALLSLGNVRNQQKNYDEGIGFLTKGIEILERMGDLHAQARSLISLGGAQFHAGKAETALGYLQRARRLCHELGDPHGEGIALWNLGTVLHSLGKHEKGVDCVSQASRLVRRDSHEFKQIMAGSLPLAE